MSRILKTYTRTKIISIKFYLLNSISIRYTVKLRAKKSIWKNTKTNQLLAPPLYFLNKDSMNKTITMPLDEYNEYLDDKAYLDSLKRQLRLNSWPYLIKRITSKEAKRYSEIWLFWWKYAGDSNRYMIYIDDTPLAPVDQENNHK